MRVNSTQKELGNEGRKEGASVYDVHVRKEEKGGLRIKPICEQTAAYGEGEGPTLYGRHMWRQPGLLSIAPLTKSR